MRQQIGSFACLFNGVINGKAIKSVVVIFTVFQIFLFIFSPNVSLKENLVFTDNFKHSLLLLFRTNLIFVYNT